MSEFRKRKLRTFFSLFDFDKDGLMTKEDHAALATRFAKFEKADEQKSEYIRTQFANSWDQYFKYSEDKKQHTRDEWVDGQARQRYDPDFIRCDRGLMRAVFDLMDVNCDGYLQEDEHRRIFDHMGVQDTSFAKDTFKAIDVNGDGKLSFEEFMDAYFDFSFSEDEKSPNRFFFGPLVD